MDRLAQARGALAGLAETAHPGEHKSALSAFRRHDHDLSGAPLHALSDMIQMFIDVLFRDPYSCGQVLCRPLPFPQEIHDLMSQRIGPLKRFLGQALPAP